MLSASAIMQRLMPDLLGIHRRRGRPLRPRPADPTRSSATTISSLAILVGHASLILTLLARSHWGLILRAIRGDEATCQAAGINVTFYKIASLMISAAFAGLGGALYAHYQLQVSPQLFAVVVSITIIIMVYVGGIGSIYGAGRRRDPADAADRDAARLRRIAAVGLHADADPDPVLPAAAA